MGFTRPFGPQRGWAVQLAAGLVWLAIAGGQRLAWAESVPAPASRIPATGRERVTPRPFDTTYGVYAGDQKIGWMRRQLTVDGAAAHLVTEMHVRVSGMGKERTTHVHEARDYPLGSQDLSRVRFSQVADTAKVEVNASRQDSSQMRVDVVAGGAPHSMFLPVAERLSDALVNQRLARAAKVRSQLHSQTFDPSLQKVMHNTHTIEAVEKRMFAGVPAQAIRVMSRSLELGVPEISWLDPQGKVLEMQVAGMFTARLESPEVARTPAYSHDMLMSQAVRAPQKLIAPQNLAALTLRMAKVEDFAPPTGGRQQVQEEAGAQVVRLRKDAIPPRVPMGKAPLPTAQEAAAVHEALEPTAFVQSRHPEIVATAKEVVGDAPDVFTALGRLSRWVFTTIVKEYRPEFSNALESLHSKRGDCTEHSVLFVALARAVGVPARVAVGVAYWPPSDGFGWHAWAEAFVGDRWVAIDPTWNQPIADATHLKLADGGLAEQARIIGLIGQLKILSMEAR